MGINRLFGIALGVLLSMTVLAQNQGYRYYTVQQGETAESIAKTQKVDRAALDKLNPEVRYGLKAGMVLLLPKSEEVPAAAAPLPKEPSTTPEPSEMREEPKSKPAERATESQNPSALSGHAVVAGDTWYSLSRAWGCTVDEAKAANPGMEVLKVGTVVQPPVKKGATAPIPASTTPKNAPKNAAQKPVEHQVAAGETLYGLSKKYQCTVDQLKAWNGGLVEGLKVGQTLVVGQAPAEVAPTSIPATPLPASPQRQPGDPLRVALILPFTQDGSDSTTTPAKKLQQEQKVASFYAGVLMAIDSLRTTDARIELRVFDDANRASKLDSIARDPFVSESHFVLGPLYGNTLTGFAVKHSGWIVSPMSVQLERKSTPHVIDLMPGTEERLHSLAEWMLWSGQNAKLLLVSSASAEEIAKRNRLAQSLTGMNMDWDTARYSATGSANSRWKQVVASDRPVVVVALTQERSLIGALASAIAAREGGGGRLVCLQELSQLQLYDKPTLVKARLSIVRAFDLDEEQPSYRAFVRNYKKRFHREPDLFSLQGHDAFWMACQAFMDGDLATGERYEGFHSGWQLYPESQGGFGNSFTHMVGLKDWEWERIY